MPRGVWEVLSATMLAAVGVLAVGAFVLDAREVSSYGWAWSGYAAVLTAAFVVGAFRVMWKQEARIRVLEQAPAKAKTGPLVAMLAAGRALKDEHINPSNPIYTDKARKWESQTYTLLLAADTQLAQSFKLGDPQISERTPAVRATDNWDRFMDVRMKRLDEIVTELRAHK